MNWEAISAIAELAGAVGVIVTLLYLAVQIRQNTKASRLAAIQTASDNSADFSEMIATQPEISEILWRGLRAPDSLSVEELRQFMAIMNTFMRRESVSYYLYQEGLMPEELWEARVHTLSSTFNQQGTRVYLEIAGNTLPSRFLAFMNGLMSQPSLANDRQKQTFGVAGEPAPKDP